VNNGTHDRNGGEVMPAEGGETAKNNATPPTTHPTPAQLGKDNETCLLLAIIGRAKTKSSPASGATSVSGPKNSAVAWRAYETTSSSVAMTHVRCRARCTSNRGRMESPLSVLLATRCCTTAATAYVAAAASANTTAARVRTMPPYARCRRVVESLSGEMAVVKNEMAVVKNTTRRRFYSCPIRRPDVQA
jgi:hypothetical protein